MLGLARTIRALAAKQSSDSGAPRSSTGHGAPSAEPSTAPLLNGRVVPGGREAVLLAPEPGDAEPVVDLRMMLSWWYSGVDFSKVRRGNVAELMAYAFYFKSMWVVLSRV